MTQHTQKRWTEDEERRLLELRAAGKSAIAVGRELKRTEAAVVQRTGMLKQRDK